MKKIFNLLIYFYVFIFGRKIFSKFNVILFKIIIKSLGYNNYGSYNFTGEKNFIKKLNNYNPKLCLDIGANIGNYSKMLLKHTTSNVIAFEPNKFSYKILKKLKIENKKRFKCYNIAVSDKNKSGYLFYGTKTSELASMMENVNKLKFTRGANINKMKIKLSTLDNVYKKNKRYFKGLDFIKIDTEGHELEVLKGARNLLKDLKPKFLQIEFNTHQLLKNVTILDYQKFLKNYKSYRLLPFGKKFLPISFLKPEDNIFHLSNILFVRSDLKIDE